MRTHLSSAAASIPATTIFSSAIKPPSFDCCEQHNNHQPIFLQPSDPSFNCWSSTTTSCFGCCKHPNSHQLPYSIITPPS
ncbi:unnamed protein product [Prunus brigantina]